jgi:hypothetical protein
MKKEETTWQSQMLQYLVKRQEDYEKSSNQKAWNYGSEWDKASKEIWGAKPWFTRGGISESRNKTDDWLCQKYINCKYQISGTYVKSHNYWDTASFTAQRTQTKKLQAGLECDVNNQHSWQVTTDHHFWIKWHSWHTRTARVFWKCSVNAKRALQTLMNKK